MKLGNKELLAIVGAIAVLLLWWNWGNLGAQAVPATTDGCEPNNPWCSGSPFSWPNGMPSFPTNQKPFAPPNITTNVNSFGGLGQYFPLFGFVGVDTTQIYQ